MFCAEAAVAERAWHVTQALLAADALGVTEAMLEMSVSYAKERHAFGRPIGSYQAIKHQIVEILRHAGTIPQITAVSGTAIRQESRKSSDGLNSGDEEARRVYPQHW